MNHEVPSDEDLMNLANKIPPENMRQIAITHLSLTNLEVNFCRSNSAHQENPVLMFHFYCLEKWRNKRGSNGTKSILYDCLVEASRAGLMDRTSLDFLKDRVLNDFSWKIFM